MYKWIFIHLIGLEPIIYYFDGKRFTYLAKDVKKNFLNMSEEDRTLMIKKSLHPKYNLATISTHSFII